MSKTLNIVIGIVMLVLCAGNVYFGISHGFSPRILLISLACLLYGITRFMMIGSPNAPLIKPLRTIALVSVIAGIVLRSIH